MSQSYIPSFMEISPKLLKKFFEVFLTYGHGGHLGHVTSIISTHLHFFVRESMHIKFGSEWPSAFIEKPVLIFICILPWAKVKK